MPTEFRLIRVTSIGRDPVSDRYQYQVSAQVGEKVRQFDVELTAWEVVAEPPQWAGDRMDVEAMSRRMLERKVQERLDRERGQPCASV